MSAVITLLLSIWISGGSVRVLEDELHWLLLRSWLQPLKILLLGWSHSSKNIKGKVAVINVMIGVVGVVVGVVVGDVVGVVVGVAAVVPV